MTRKAFWLSILLLSLFLLPNALSPLRIGNFSFEWQLGDLLIAVTGIYLLLKILLLNGKMHFVSGITRLDKIVSILLVVTIFSSIIGSLRFSSSVIFIFGSLIKVIEPYILYFFVRSNLYRGKDASYILKTLILITVIISLIGLIQMLSPNVYLNIIKFFFSKSRILQDENFINTVGWRISSLFLASNKFANFILLMLPFIFIRQSFKMRLIKKVFYLVLMVLLLVLLIFTLSREGWLGFMFMFIYILYIGTKYKISPSIKRNTATIFIIVTLLIAISYTLIYNRMIKYTFGGIGFEYLYETSSSEARFILWEASLKAISKNWLLGTGPMGGKIVQEFVPSYFITGGDPHNTFLRTFLETGIIGFIAFLFFIKELLSFGKLHLIHSFDIYKYSIVASTIGLIFSGFLGDSFQDFEIIATLFILVALLENVREKRKFKMKILPINGKSIHTEHWIDYLNNKNFKTKTLLIKEHQKLKEQEGLIIVK